MSENMADDAGVQSAVNAVDRLGRVFADSVREAEFWKLKLQRAEQRAESAEQSYGFLMERLEAADVDVAALLRTEDGADVTEFPVRVVEEEDDGTASS